MQVATTGLGRTTSSRLGHAHESADPCTTGHTATVSDVRFRETDQQAITNSMDTIEPLWDLSMCKTMTKHMHYKKSVCALSIEYPFASAPAFANDFKK